MKQKVFAVVMLGILVFCLAGCKKSFFGIQSNDNRNVEISAVNADEEMSGTVSGLDVAEGQKIYVEPSLTKGELSVKIGDAGLPEDASEEDLMDALSNSSVLDIKVSGKEAAEYEIEPGSYSLSVSVLSKADGKVLISVR